MYLDFFEFTRPPFHVTPDPEFLFLSPSHKEALASIVYGIERRKGFVAIIGEVGVGKTTVLRSYLETADSLRLRAISLFNPKISFPELLRFIHRELGSDPGDGDVAELVERLQHVLIEEYRRGRNVALVVDEAQAMPVETLECLRILSNLETSVDKLVQIVLVGQPELDRMLGRPDLRQLRQRIAVRAVISPLSRSESTEYVRHRLSRVAREDARVFSRKALKTIVEHARGIPRTINILCDNALVTSFGYGRKIVSRKVVREILDDRGERTWRRKAGRGLALAGFSAAAAVAVWIGAPSSVDVNGYRKPAGDGYRRIAGAALERVARVPPETKFPSGPAPQAAPAAGIPARDRSVERAESRTGAEGNPVGMEESPAGAGNPPVAKEAPPARSTREEATGPPRRATGQSAREGSGLPGAPASRVVRKGDYLSRLLVDVYGTSDAETIARVMRRNPVIRDPDRIYEGTRIVFPKQPAAPAPQGRAKERNVP